MAKIMPGRNDAGARSRVLRFLTQGTATIADAAARGSVLLDAGERGTVCAERKLLAEMVREGELRMAGGKIELASTAEPKQAENRRDIGTMTVDTETGRDIVAVNWSESPLGQLMRRKGRDGSPFLSAAEFQAGERLRADCTRGQIMPRMGANWVASVSSGRRDGGIVELTDAALAARIRVEHAIRAVGPELSGILIDVCCFLKGMETVEMERGWPVRSGKIVLKTALGILSRHYNPDSGRARRPQQMLHWGAADYRPSIT
ncbi:DUF6456 domain-containing protein [Mesorhizobium sp. KR9-304]|uniref:DUF6456 domain-containing protein n=1 Tax=Mesorhizobium sp. KR9-304 TaxID=3156614 RepID=UPI0032B3196A